MRKRWYFVLAMLATGCTTCPQADFMDFAFKSRNACCPPAPAAGAIGVASMPVQPCAPNQPCAPANAVATMPVMAAQAPPPMAAPEEKKKGHPWLHPFRRNRD